MKSFLYGFIGIVIWSVMFVLGQFIGFWVAGINPESIASNFVVAFIGSYIGVVLCEILYDKGKIEQRKAIYAVHIVYTSSLLTYILSFGTPTLILLAVVIGASLPIIYGLLKRI